MLQSITSYWCIINTIRRRRTCCFRWEKHCSTGKLSTLSELLPWSCGQPWLSPGHPVSEVPHPPCLKSPPGSMICRDFLNVYGGNSLSCTQHDMAGKRLIFSPSSKPGGLFCLRPEQCQSFGQLPPQVGSGPTRKASKNHLYKYPNGKVSIYQRTPSCL